MQQQRGRLSQRGIPIRDSPIFNWLVRYHYEVNLPAYRKELDRVEHLPIPPGRENNYTTGCLIIENGDRLVRKLKSERLILDSAPPQFKEAQTYEQFSTILSHNQYRDGAFFYDGKHGQMARVACLRNTSPQIDKARERRPALVPPDFLEYGRTEALTPEELDEQMGTKTDLALVLPVAYTTADYTVRAYQIKRTAYGDSGMGKVAAFGAQGLEQEFFFEDLFPPVGVRRKYESPDGRLVKIRETIVSPLPLERKVA